MANLLCLFITFICNDVNNNNNNKHFEEKCNLGCLVPIKRPPPDETIDDCLKIVYIYTSIQLYSLTTNQPANKPIDRLFIFGMFFFFYDDDLMQMRNLRGLKLKKNEPNK